jgi:hypothetical protein
LLVHSRSFHNSTGLSQAYTRNVAVRSFNSLRICASIVVALLAASAAYAQELTYVLIPVNDGIGDTLTGTITTDGNLGVLQGSDILSFQFTYDLSAGLTIDDHTPSIDAGTWGSSDGSAFVVNTLLTSPTGVEATASTLTYVGGGNLWFADAPISNAEVFISNSSVLFSDQHLSEQTGTPINPVFATAPEIDPASASSALALLFGGIAVLRGRRRA